MGNIMNSIVLGVFVLIVTQWLIKEKLLRSLRRLPPGPTPLPIIGNLHNLSQKPHKSLAELAKIHGPLMLLRFGYRTAVVISSPEVAREVLQKKEIHFSSRTVPDCVCIPKIVDFSVAVMPIGHRWRTIRKLTNTMLMTNKALEANKDIRMKKMKDFVSYLRSCSEGGVAVNIGKVAFEANLNFLSNIFFSMDLADHNSEFCREFMKLTWSIIGDFSKANLADLFPAFKHIDPQGLRRRMVANYGKLFKIFDTIVEQRLASRKPGEPDSHNDILDSLLKICADNTQDFELNQINPLLMDVIIAGTETTSNMIEWAMAELLHEPSKLKKTQDELDRVIGRGNMVQEADSAQLPYLQQVIKETYRLHPPGPLLVPRKADSETEVHGYMVPKDSQVIVNVWAIGRDPNIWKNPNKFEPERFLNSEIDAKGNHFELIPFGAGRRICPGMPLASSVVPLMLANLLNLFDWKLSDGLKPEDMDMDDEFRVVLKKAIPLLVIPISVVT